MLLQSLSIQHVLYLHHVLLDGGGVAKWVRARNHILLDSVVV